MKGFVVEHPTAQSIDTGATEEARKQFAEECVRDRWFAVKIRGPEGSDYERRAKESDELRRAQLREPTLDAQNALLREFLQTRAKYSDEFIALNAVAKFLADAAVQSPNLWPAAKAVMGVIETYWPAEYKRLFVGTEGAIDKIPAEVAEALRALRAP